MKSVKDLERQMVTYSQLCAVKSRDSNEPLVALEPRRGGALVSRYAKLQDMIPLLGTKVVVRKTLVQKLTNVATEINNLNPSWRLQVTYGYRSPEVQTKYFWYKLEQLAKQAPLTVPTPVNLYEEIHRSVAVPQVAGHPTGGAVDVCLLDKSGELIDCGSKLYDLTDTNRYVFAVSEKNNPRFILRQAMMRQNFAPFDGEWWHYSYGDKEWAAYYYQKPFAIYSQISLRQVKQQLKIEGC